MANSPIDGSRPILVKQSRSLSTCTHSMQCDALTSLAYYALRIYVRASYMQENCKLALTTAAAAVTSIQLLQHLLITE
eukprot:21367-Heterococcus_DN1.PRE.3